MPIWIVVKVHGQYVALCISTDPLVTPEELDSVPISTIINGMLRRIYEPQKKCE